VTASPVAGACPKCGRPQTPEATACARCGLVFAHWSPERAKVAAASDPDPETERLWSVALASWSDEAGHEAFVKHCSAAGRLDLAGRRYRARLDADADDAIARKMQTRIIGMATVALEVASTPPVPMGRRTWFWWVLGAAAVGGALAGIVRAFAR